MSVDGWNDTTHNITNLGEIVNIKYVGTRSVDNAKWSFGAKGGTTIDGTSASQVVVTSTLLRVWKPSSEVNSFIVTIQYTKTIDGAISIGLDTDYSLEEKIIGTWINGKPLYQKVLNNINMLSDSYDRQSIDVSDLNIDNVIKIDGGWLKINNSGFTPIISAETTSPYCNTAFYLKTQELIYLTYGTGIKSQLQSAIIILQYTKTTD